MRAAAPVTARRLSGRSALVTGAGHGIGSAYARRLATEGANVVVADIDASAADSVARELRDSGADALGVAVDVAQEGSVREMHDAAREAFGRIDVLVNNAAMFAKFPVSHGDDLGSLTVEQFEAVLRVNVIGTWLCIRELLPEMVEQGYGKIINVSSGTVFKGSGGDMIHYVASKAAILGLTRTLARVVGPSGVRVNCIAPGLTVTESFSEAQLQVARERAVAERPLGRVETPSDLVGAVAFLASADSDFMTGQTMVVDGGAYMH
ncbi:MAG: glucose 1-dehydrogenase [Actinomycetota bacterium]|jgi:3-oxoacyl-[acyl-carrier protein] reductase|nr:glucose 1-dehydrogenase [Actinomycetota bacterium]